MANIFEELLNSLKGAAGTDVNKVKSDAVAGGREVLGLDPHQPDQNAPTMSVQPDASAPVAPLSVSSPTPPVKLPAEVQTMLASAASSPKSAPGAARQGTSAQVPAAPDAEFADLLARATRTHDRTGERDDLARQRDDLTAKSEGHKKLTDEEQVAMALLAAVPGLFGALAGGAISGGAGAAAGAAGGLQGGANGIKMLVDAKDAKVKEFKDDAEKVDARVARLNEQIAAEKEKSMDKDLSLRLQERAGQKAAALQKEKLLAEAGVAHENNKTQLTTTAMNNKGAMDRTRFELGMKARIDGNKPVKYEDSDKSFYVNTDSAMHDISELEKVIAKEGNWESLVGDPATRATLSQRALDLAIAYAKIVDPASAAREGEVETAKKYGFPMGMLEGNKTSMAALRGMRNMIQEKARARGELGGPIPQSVMAESPHSSPEDAQAIEWARANSNDPRAQAIFSIHGIK